MSIETKRNSRYVYLSGETQITVLINPEITFSSKNPAFFGFNINSNTDGMFSFKIIGTETVMNERHGFLQQEYRISGPFGNVSQPISPEGFLRSVKLKNGSIKYKAEFYFNKINICTCRLYVTIPNSWKEKIPRNYQLFANPSNLLFSIEGSRILFLHTDQDRQFLISPFRPKLVIVGGQMIKRVSYSLVEETGFKVKYRPHSWDPSMNVIKKDRRALLNVNLEPEDFEIQDGTVLMLLEVLRLQEFVEPDVKGNYISIQHSLSVNVYVEDGNNYTLGIPIQVISH
ncbi:hypothetical protein HDV01_001124 [Terramyces sp. JEL0728]|nr:hypothetical protein HDV01_001124 [Terramyces sp. JEL0728]